MREKVIDVSRRHLVRIKKNSFRLIFSVLYLSMLALPALATSKTKIEGLHEALVQHGIVQNQSWNHQGDDSFSIVTLETEWLFEDHILETKHFIVVDKNGAWIIPRERAMFIAKPEDVSEIINEEVRKSLDPIDAKLFRLSHDIKGASIKALKVTPLKLDRVLKRELLLALQPPSGQRTTQVFTRKDKAAFSAIKILEAEADAVLQDKDLIPFRWTPLKILDACAYVLRVFAGGRP